MVDTIADDRAFERAWLRATNSYAISKAGARIVWDEALAAAPKVSEPADPTPSAFYGEAMRQLNAEGARATQTSIRACAETLADVEHLIFELEDAARCDDCGQLSNDEAIRAAAMLRDHARIVAELRAERHNMLDQINALGRKAEAMAVVLREWLGGNISGIKRKSLRHRARMALNEDDPWAEGWEQCSGTDSLARRAELVADAILLNAKVYEEHGSLGERIMALTLRGWADALKGETAFTTLKGE